MKQVRLKDLNRKQLIRLLKANAIGGWNTRTTTHNLRLKFNALGGEFAWLSTTNKGVIQWH